LLPAAADNQAVRAVCVIDPDKKIMTLGPMMTGRNFDEMLKDRLTTVLS
jgi:alkyl hydroperoxide reductase subunit AhpC